MGKISYFFVDIIARIGLRAKKIKIWKCTVADMGLIYWTGEHLMQNLMLRKLPLSWIYFCALTGE